MWVISSLDTVLTPTAIALGNFDGVHRGHQQVIQPVLQGSGSGLERIQKTVVTFHPHPQEFFTGHSRQLLTPLDEKVLQLQQMGIDQLVLLPFDRELANLTPEQFVEQILIQQLQARQISVGVDFRFGHQRSGTAQDLQAIAARFGVEVTIVSLQTCQGERISSSNIRAALHQGDLRQANRLLGRSYSLTGTVVPGQKLGRTLGFPTANLKLPPEKFLPRKGVYCVKVWIASQDPPANSTPETTPLIRDPAELLPWLPGVMNLGCRPTVDGTQLVTEVHLLDWSRDLYGQTLIVYLEEFLRPEQKFGSLTELKEQIQADCETARTILMASNSGDGFVRSSP
ncbi:riboflavin biosynthesis protein RibF [Leptolyngbya sp. 'hensonii']|nr:riboflavin biosynthesis protein RibF [Leptolyngbya sp. 'hensonii']